MSRQFSRETGKRETGKTDERSMRPIFSPALMRPRQPILKTITIAAVPSNFTLDFVRKFI
jgi:hypothetical protein